MHANYPPSHPPYQPVVTRVHPIAHPTPQHTLQHTPLHSTPHSTAHTTSQHTHSTPQSTIHSTAHPRGWQQPHLFESTPHSTPLTPQHTHLCEGPRATHVLRLVMPQHTDAAAVRVCPHAATHPAASLDCVQHAAATAAGTTAGHVNTRRIRQPSAPCAGCCAAGAASIVGWALCGLLPVAWGGCS